MLTVWLEARSDAFLGSRARRARGREGSEILVFQEYQPRRRTPGCPIGLAIGTTSTVASHTVEGRNNDAQVRSIESIGAILPVLAAKGTDGQVQLHDVVKDSITAKHFHLPIPEYVPSSPQPRSNLVSPAEVDGIAFCSGWLVFSGQVFLIKPNSRVDGYSLTDGPSILHEKTVVPTLCIAVGTEVPNSGKAV